MSEENEHPTSNSDVATAGQVVEDVAEIRDYEQCGCQIECGNNKSRRIPCPMFNYCNNSKGVLVFLSVVALFQGFVMNGLINGVITTLERRFSLQSSETGLIASSYDIGTCFSLLFVTYVGGRGHKPLWLGWGTMLMGVGSIIFALPHFIAPSYIIPDSVNCVNISSASCGEASIRVYRGFFITSQLLHGIGTTPLYTLALTYLDENVKQVYSSVYHGVFYAVSLIGPGLGYLLGGQLLNIYTNPGETVDITPDSVLWVGNWWVGFLIGGFCFFLLSIPILMFPKQLPDTDKHRKSRANEMHQNSDALRVCDDEEFGKSVRDAPRCLWILLKNPTIVLISLAGAMDNGIIAGVATFGPKYFESMFSLTAAYAAFLIGLIAIVSSALGQIIGGVVVSKLNFTVRKMLGMCTICSVLGLACLFIFIMNCENTKIAGVTIPYNGQSNIICNTTACGCSTEFYDPVCGADNMTYLSYCDAGCDQVSAMNFDNCSGVLDSSSISEVSMASAIKGKCVQDTCQNMGLFAVIIALAVFFIFLSAQPALQASLRAVPYFQRSFAIGIQWLILRLLGSVPMPNILGAVLDLSCTVWGMQCGVCGSCKIYNNQDMSKYMTIVLTVVKAFSVFFFALAWKTYKSPPPKADESESTAVKTTCSPTKSADAIQGIAMTEVDHKKTLPEDRSHDNPNFVPDS
ncbi:solute carrier organic anion transporter family member 4A1-like [Styela clava]